MFNWIQVKRNDKYCILFIFEFYTASQIFCSFGLYIKWLGKNGFFLCAWVDLRTRLHSSMPYKQFDLYDRCRHQTGLVVRKSGRRNSKPATRNAFPHTSTFQRLMIHIPKSLTRVTSWRLVSVITTPHMVSKTKPFNQRPHFGREKHLVLVKHFLIPGQGWVRGPKSSRHGVCFACDDHTPLMRRRWRSRGETWWRRMWFWQECARSLICTNACGRVWLCTLLPSMQNTADTNNRPHLLVITAETPDTM